MKRSSPETTSHFLSCDWGTSSFRLRLVGRPGERVLASVQSDNGAKAIHARLEERGLANDPAARRTAFAAVLSDGIARLADQHPGGIDGTPAIVSGMASSTIGWKELPYAPIPCPLDGSGLHVEEMEALVRHGSRHRVWMVSGLSTGTDILRGEEMEALGILALPAFAPLQAGCRIVLPGTHSKHITVRDGAIVGFHTHLTGELLELLSTRSILGVSVCWPPPPFESPDAGEDDQTAFAAGVTAAKTDGLSQSLFQVRVRSVLHRTTTTANSRFLAGLLVGAELASLLAGSPSTPILLAAASHFVAPYRLAFETLGARSRIRVATSDQISRAILQAHALVLDRVAPATPSAPAPATTA